MNAESAGRGGRSWAIAVAIAGVVTLATTIAFRMLPEVSAAGSCMAADAVVKFEFARTAADIDAIFGPPGGPCRAGVVTAMDATNTLDTRLYIPSYTAFVVFAALFLSGGRLRLPVLAAAVAGVGALAADYVETFSLLAYTPDLTPTTAQLATSSSAAWIKFWLLGVNALALAWVCVTEPKRRIILGVLLCLPIVGVVLAFFAGQLAVMTLGFVLGWTPLLALAIRASLIGR
jgi:hypothetical protein